MVEFNDSPDPEFGQDAGTLDVQRSLSDRLAAGHRLTDADVAELREALSTRDASIEHYQKLELDLRRQVEEGRHFVNEVLANLAAPIFGYGLQQGQMTGMFHDRWIGPQLKLAIMPRRPVQCVTLHGWIPNDMPPDGELTLHVGELRAGQPLRPGMFALAVDLPAPTESTLRIDVRATKWVTPEGPAGRTLVFVLQNIELGHPG